MQNYSTILHPDRTRANLDSGSKKRILQQGAETIARDFPDISERELFKNLMERERLGSTGLGEGVAIPHCRIDGLPEVVGAFATLTDAIDFDAPDQQPVDIIFILVVPANENEAHLKILAKLASIFGEANTRQTLRSIRSNLELFETIAQLLGN